MKTYAEVLMIAIPMFIGLLFIEYLVSRYRKMEVINSFDTISSLSSGITNTIKDVLGLAVIILSYDWMVNHVAIFDIKSSVLAYVLAFIGIDFAGYWTHRFEHEINLLWNRHIIHHSSEEFNLACALRQNVSAIFGIFFFLFLPMAIIGVPAEVVAVVAPIHLFAQFWYHTRLINKMGFLEYIIVTPSHHRVHHAINDKYLDKNYGQIFIIWDKMFGTFQEELDEEKAVFGVKRQVNTWNPLLINFQHLLLLIKDAFYTKRLGDKLRVFYMPTGWRPKDREENDPVEYIKDPKTQVKYFTTASTAMHIWLWIQLITTLLLMLFMFSRIDQVDFEYILLYGLFLTAGIFAYTSLMDRSNWSYLAESIKLIVGGVILWQLGTWFDLELLIPFGTAIIISYLIFSFFFNIYFMKKEPLLHSIN
mgnify:CR=1 FL=1